MSTLGPPVGGPSNRERSGTRDLCVSAALRRVPDVRHADLDFYQYCPLCRVTEVVLEASSDPRKASDLSRRMGKKIGAHTLLIIHRYGDIEHEHPVTISVWDPSGVKLIDKRVMSWSEFLKLMHDFHDLHLLECAKNV